MYQFILTIHIFFGSIGLILGTLVMIRKKGDKSHKQLGKYFAMSMLLAALLSFSLSIIHPNIFLFTIGIFTMFMVITGWRYLYLRKLNNNQKPLLFDKITNLIMLAFCCSFFYMGINSLLQNNYFGLAPLILGIFSTKYLIEDLKIYFGKIKEPNYWLLEHIKRMSGAYIASFTAFLVNTSGRIIAKIPAMDNFAFLVWVLPAIIALPFIIKWVKFYSIKRVNSE